MQREQDGLRRLLLCEPRGSVARHINLITPPARDDCDIGMITMEPTEFVPMSGSNLICTVTVALETGILAMHEPETIVRVDTAAGPVRARATCRDGKCVSVEFANVPSLVDRLDADAGNRWARHASSSTSPMAACGTPSPMRRSSAFASSRTKGASWPSSARRSAWPRASNSTSCTPRTPTSPA